MPMYVDGRLNFFKRTLHGTIKYQIVSLGLGVYVDDERVGCTFEKNVRDEEQRQGDIVLYAGHAQIFHHAFNLCVANVGSVDVSLYREDHMSAHRSF